MVARLSALAAEVCAGRQVYVLEGGYRLAALARAVEVCLRVLLDEAQAPPAAPALHRPEIDRLLGAAARLHGLPA
jgi:acetoin utilization deacetylase AcuC-like enzyme